MPSTFSKYAAYSTIPVLLIAVFLPSWSEDILMFPGVFFGILIYYNIFLYFQEAYKSIDRRVAKEKSRSLAHLSALYVVTSGINAFNLGDIEKFSRSEMLIIGGVTLFIFGYISFWWFVFFLRFAFSHSSLKNLSKW